MKEWLMARWWITCTLSLILTVHDWTISGQMMDYLDFVVELQVQEAGLADHGLASVLVAILVDKGADVLQKL